MLVRFLSTDPHQGIFIIIKMVIFFFFSKRGKKDRLAPPGGIDNSQGKGAGRRGEKLTPEGVRASTSLAGTTKGLRDQTPGQLDAYQQKAHLGHRHDQAQE